MVVTLWSSNFSNLVTSPFMILEVKKLKRRRRVWAFTVNGSFCNVLFLTHWHTCTRSSTDLSRAKFWRFLTVEPKNRQEWTKVKKIWQKIRVRKDAFFYPNVTKLHYTWYYCFVVIVDFVVLQANQNLRKMIKGRKAQTNQNFTKIIK
ncbi:hypothetical protein BDL97_18G005300 [Sphagnum fallax]|nr:hypothetical protein BDL97_18G005300 [Sphagnum fallax]